VVEFLVKEASANLGSKNMWEETALTPTAENGDLEVV